MTDKGWITASEASEKVNIPVETIRRYLRSHSVHIKVKKVNKKYLIHDDCMTVLKQIRTLYEQGKNADEVEETLSASGIPMTITVKDERDDSVTVHVADELKEIKQELKEQKEFNLRLVEYFEQKFEDLKADRELISSLKSSMQQKKLEADDSLKIKEQLGNIENQLTEIQQTKNTSDTVVELSEQISGLQQQLKQMNQMIQEVAISKEKQGFFSRLFKR